MNNSNSKNQGHLHPITILSDKIANIFTKMGFDIVGDRELEREWYNFDALNVAKGHPSRDMQDTFFLKLKEDEKIGKAVLRTHTSSVQIRYMTEKMKEIRNKSQENPNIEKEIFPIAIICPGKVYRNEATDATHEAQFHQVEGLLVGENISLANLKAILEKFFSELFFKSIDIIFRSSYFPFRSEEHTSELQSQR